MWNWHPSPLLTAPKPLKLLCAELNALDTKFPGTCLRLKLAIQPHEPLTKA